MARRKVGKKDRRSASRSKPAVYFKHEYRFRSVTGVMTAMAYPGAFALITLGMFGWVLCVTCCYVLLAFGIVVGNFDKARLDGVAPSLLVFIPFGAIFGWVTYRMGLKFPRNIVRDARFDVYITEIGIIIGSVFYAWEDIRRVGYSHILPFFRGFLEFRFGEDDYWIPTRQWIPWREYRKLTQTLKEHIQLDYPLIFGSHTSPLGANSTLRTHCSPSTSRDQSGVQRHHKETTPSTIGPKSRWHDAVNKNATECNFTCVKYWPVSLPPVSCLDSWNNRLRDNLETDNGGSWIRCDHRASVAD